MTAANDEPLKTLQLENARLRILLSKFCLAISKNPDGWKVNLDELLELKQQTALVFKRRKQREKNQHAIRTP